MPTIISDNFLLNNSFAQELYHEYASTQPIIDFHCHLPSKELAEDFQFENITQIWLKGDHYKWRAMRANGIAEELITGSSGDKDKFMAWAQTVPKTVRNPLFHWTHLELKRYFGIENYLNVDSAESIYKTCNKRLNSDSLSARQIPVKMNVEVICTTDDPTDTLKHHKILKEDGYPVKVLPTFRPDNILRIENPDFYKKYLLALGSRSDINISSYDDLLLALKNRVEYFHEIGCRLSDHGLQYLHSSDFKKTEAEDAIKKVLNGKNLDPELVENYKSSVLYDLSRMYHSKGWTQQFHLGALRNLNSKLHSTLGPDSGADSIGDFPQAEKMAKYFDQLENEDALAKTIIYNLNPADNEVFATMIGNFQDGRLAGKMQLGSAWWFLDQKDGIEKQLNVLSYMGLLSRFVGMVTDSRSFLSYPRHEYFRRILCNLLGTEMEKGELPKDMKWIGDIVKDISYGNASTFFGFNE